MMMTYNNTSNAEAIETVYTYNELLNIYNRNKTKEREEKKNKILQKLLGVALLFIGVLGCAIFPEDAGGCLFACALGVFRVIF